MENTADKPKRKAKGEVFGRALTVQEVDALIRYVSEHGLDPQGKYLPELNTAKNEWQRTPEDSEHCAQVLSLYTALSARTTPVNGRTLIESERSHITMMGLALLTGVLIVLAAISGTLSIWIADQPDLDDLDMISMVLLFLDYVNPFVWGALGACVYLMKHLYDIATRLEFDTTLYRGWWIRVVLGAVLGGVVYQLYGISGTDDTTGELSRMALAFFTGLGVRVVYGAFERTIDVIAEKMNLGAVRKEGVGRQDARSLLTQHLAKIDPDQEPEKYAALLGVLNDLGDNNKNLEQ